MPMSYGTPRTILQFHPVKLLHTSDWHLGARLHERDRSDDQRRFLAFLRDAVAEERPDALVVAGDIFDVRQPTATAQRLYYDFLADAVRDGCCKSIVIISGNHDSAQLLAAPDRLLVRLGVRVVTGYGVEGADEVVAVGDGRGGCALAIAAVPFMSDAALANSARVCEGSGGADLPTLARRVADGFRIRYAAAIGEARRLADSAPIVAMGHCTVTGAQLSDQRSERGRQIGGLDERDAGAFAGADYVALGHLHVPQTLGEGGRVRYCGSPLPMSFAEAESRKSISVVEFGERSGDAVRLREIAVPEFTPLRVIEGAQEEIREKLLALSASASSPVLAALKVTGGDGDMAAFVGSARAVATGSHVEILQIEDARPRTATAAQVLRDETQTLEALAPHDVGMMRLADEHLSQDELAVYSAMLSDVIAETL